jgi:glutaminyl-tRNA synthetase
MFHFIALSQSLILNYSSLKLNRLVTEKWVDGWDDPRLMTLAGLRRRGMTSTAINSFVRGIGITRR